ncbi:thioredoxin family protein [Natrinema amylolyticum]|uniref:thioredoxin family protein n=1 Tax=Natrinema amylolyticum TaxID=2878679 RepID=UPI001CFBB256|nr:thioredoxin family protein [Natrinema amylolyticum]
MLVLIVHIDESSYESLVENERLVLLYFWAEWCGPCQVLDSMLEELADEFPALVVARIDTDTNETIMNEFGVETIPTLILFEHGEPVEIFAGKVPYLDFKKRVDRHI